MNQPRSDPATTSRRAAERRQPAVVTLLKGLALAASVGLLVGLAGSAVEGLEFAAVPMILAGLFIGYLASDFLSGAVHWFCDTFLGEQTPLVGRIVIRPFREHHRDPALITRYRMLEQDGTSSFLLVPILLVALEYRLPDAGGAGLLLTGVLTGFAAGALLTNLFHKWAHAEQVPPFVRFLQQYRLILSPRAHQVHHVHHDRAYCVTSGWVNALADRTNWFGRLEMAIRAVLPRRLQAGK